VANQNANTISQYDFGTGGVLRPKTPATVKAGGSPESVAAAPDGRSVYVTAYYAHRVYQYDIGRGGTLTPKSVPSVALPSNPGFVTVSPNGKNAYVTTFQRVRQYRVGPGGFLEPMTPTMVWAGPFPSSLAISSSGRDVYASALNGHSVYQLSVPAGGRCRRRPAVRSRRRQPVRCRGLPGTYE
jgi:DNA-binding beta-propeller fold protein YncE